MKFNSHFFSFPPHISTTWKQVASLSMNPAGCIEFSMLSGEKITLPPLSAEETNRIFHTYGLYLEKSTLAESPLLKREFPPFFNPEFPQMLSFPLKHSPSGENDPGFTEEAIQQIAEMAKLMVPKEQLDSFQAEEGCHCTYCEIARAVKQEAVQLVEIQLPGEEAAHEWVVTPMGNKLYNVSNAQNPQESYRVHLGNPVGCTCGEAHCPHILSVLKS